MKNKTIAVASALLIGGLLTFNSIAFADTSSAVDTATSASVKQKPVKAGQEAAGRMKGFEHKGIKGGQNWGLQLKDLVKAGTITQATADKIQAYLDKEQAAAKTEMEKVKAMTAEARKAYFESKKSNIAEKQDPLSTLVEKGIITQAEADAIKAAREAKQAEQQAKQKENITTALNKLVDSKVITAEQVTKITEYMTKEQAAREVEMEKIKAMTDEERDTYFKSNVENKGNMLTTLVTDKVLTQAQADAVQKVLHPRGFGKGFDKDFHKGIDRK